MADMNTVEGVSMTIAVAISTPALAIPKRNTMVYPLNRRNIQIALHEVTVAGFDGGVDAMADGDTGHGCARLQAFRIDLGFEWCRARASLAHENPGDKGDRVRLEIRGHHRP